MIMPSQRHVIPLQQAQGTHEEVNILLTVQVKLLLLLL